MAASATLASAFNPRRNSLNALRLALAATVIVSHVWPLGGYGQDPGQGPDTSNLGAWAVAGFFGISGYLITGSRLHSRNLRDFMWRRLLRIYPGFLVAVLVVAFIVSPLGTLFSPSNRWSAGSAIHFVVQALPLYLKSFAPDGSLVSVPFPDSWVPTLWTLAFEFGCYVIVGVLISFVRQRRALVACLAAWLLLSTAATLVHEVLDTPAYTAWARLARLGAFFAAGALVYCLRDRVPASPLLAALAAVIVAGLIVSGQFAAFAGLPVAYVMLYLGAVLPLSRIGGRNDVSYGMYVYGAPIQQLIVLMAGARVLPIPVFLVLSIVLTVPLAWASWLLVERPAMSLKRLTARVRPDREGHVAETRVG